MNEKVLKTLEYDKIIALLADYASSPLGRAQCQALVLAAIAGIAAGTSFAVAGPLLSRLSAMRSKTPSLRTISRSSSVTMSR